LQGRTSLEPDPRRAWHAEATAVPDSVLPLRRAVVDFARTAGLEGRVVDDVAVATSEAATNAVMHAFDGDGPGTVTVRAQVIDADTFRVIVADDGHGMRPRVSGGGLGLGLLLMAGLSRHLAISGATGGGTHVSMDFPLSIPESSAIP
jgi:anti-sigma regulatory factor (Ser/Thr protein kinase)